MDSHDIAAGSRKILRRCTTSVGFTSERASCIVSAMPNAKHKIRGKEIERLRMELGMNQTDFGRRFGATAMSVSRWERGENPAPVSAFLTMAKIARNPKDAWRFLGYAGLTRQDLATALGRV